MKSLEHLHQGKEAWNQWRRDNPTLHPMLTPVETRKQFPDCLDDYDFSYTNFCGAQLQGISMRGANFHQAILAGADLSNAHLEHANFCRTDLYKTIFANAFLNGANLQGVQLAMTDLSGADLTGCKVYGMSTWDLIRNDKTKEENLIISYNTVLGDADRQERAVVNGLDLAAFMHFTRNNDNIARLIEGANQKWVLLLGRFTEKGRVILDKLKARLKEEQYIPIIFDFGRPEQRDLIETIILLAGMSAFVIVELTDAQSTPLELQAIASSYGVPIFPVLERRASAFSMFAGLRKFRWVFPTLNYDNPDQLIERLGPEVIAPAREEARRLTELKRAVEALEAPRATAVHVSAPTEMA